MDTYVILFFIFQFIYGNLNYFSKAEPLAGPSVRLANENEFPVVVSIGRNFYEGEEGHVCTGALISRRHVLTAAHCLDEGDIETLQVSIGSVDLLASEKFSVSSWIIYDDWAKDTNQPPNDEDNDIAILTLSKTVDNPGIVVATLSSDNTFDAVGKSFTIAGWGITENGSKSRFLRTGPVTALSLMQCSDIIYRVFGVRFFLSSIYICTQYHPPTIAKCGDSGGPVLTDDHKIVGINVEGCNEDFSDEDKMNLHLGIHYYRNFIADVLQNH